MTESSKPPTGRRMKARAPPPPQAPQPAPRQIFRNSAPGGGGVSGTDAKENILRPAVDLQLSLPGGYKTSVTEDGSKALMDLLVELCGRHHLNPALHTLELVSPEGRALAFKPNALLGSLDVASVHIKEKVSEEKVAHRPAPKVPEKTIRLMVNYHGSQKAVVRVNPSVPLGTLVPVICEKCDFDTAHVLLLRDSVSRRELPLDKSLSELDIKELYVHNRSLVLQPKMASAPALYHSDSVRSSTTSLSRAEKKGFLGLFQFGRKSKGLSTASVVSSVEDQSSTLGQSQSVMNFPSMSPRTQNKKRRAPALPAAPTPSMGHAGFDSYQMGSETQQRKRKAPVPPAPNDLSVTAVGTHVAETPVLLPRADATRTAAISVSAQATQSVKVSPVKTRAEPARPRTPTNSSMSSSSSSSATNGSLAAQDSSSELSHSIDDSDLEQDRDQDQDEDEDEEGSQCSSIASSSASGSVVVVAVQRTVKASSSSGSDGESELNLKLDEVENRHSAVGSGVRQAPPKPRRSPSMEPQLVFPPRHPSSSSPTDGDAPESPVEAEDAAPQSWVHSMRSSPLGGQAAENKTPEDTTSVASSGSSSGSSSLPDQGYAPSEGTISSPSDTQPTSPEGSLSPGLLGPVRDNSSDSDEGFAMWRSRHRHRDVSSKSRAKVETGSYKEDPELTAQLHRTLADFEADLAEHADTASLKETRHDVCVLSASHSEVPVSVVDLDVPVTTIDEVFVEDSCTITPDHASEIREKSFVWSEVAETKAFTLQSSVEPQNKNNNACVAGDAESGSARLPSQTERRLRSHEDMSKRNQEGKEKLVATEVSSSAASKEIKPRTSSQAKSSVDLQKRSESKTHLWESATRSSQEKKAVALHSSQRALSAGHDDRVHQNPHGAPLSPRGAITHSTTSRFGLKTFTVVPPRPSVASDPAEVPPHASTVAAVKIDDQGNMVRAGIGHNGSGTVRASGDGSPPFGKAQQFWSSSEKPESPSRGVVERGVPVRSPSFAAAVKIDDQGNMVRAGVGHNEARKPQAESGDGSAPFGKAREFWSSSEKQESHSRGLVERDVPLRSPSFAATAKAAPLTTRPNDQAVRKEEKEASRKFGVERDERPAELRKDITFLKPSRRTSSHYVASAINKYSDANAAPRPSYAPRRSDSSIASSTASQRPGRPATIDPNPSSASLNKQSRESSLTSAHPAAPSRSISHPEVSRSDSRTEAVEVRAIREKFGGGRGSSGGITKMLELAKNRHLQSSWVDRVSTGAAANGDRDTVKLCPPLKPKPATSSPPPPKVTSPGPTINKRDSVKAVPVTTDAKQEASVTVTDGGGVTPGALSSSVFGPVQKFRPVVYRSMEKDTCLHSSLMEAIQSGRGKDGLKSTSIGPSSVKVSYVEEENERSALLAAIRAQSNSGRLRKTKSEAAAELQKGQELLFSPSPLSPPPVFSPPPPPPQAPMFVLPPPPLLLPQGKPGAAAANAATNPAMAREAMLEAIRSGAAAERLKKVAVPTKTVTVNGRMGTMRTTSATLLHQ
ncbi:protein cordon-bleu isoform X4 [Nelusetta ayraudi]|uniref:protein cordon-bleu isoform X4 n=1 Tax=Nelusetta ayraudi TaxID=303726 RepID=UPI003F715621